MLAYKLLAEIIRHGEALLVWQNAQGCSASGSGTGLDIEFSARDRRLLRTVSKDL